MEDKYILVMFSLTFLILGILTPIISSLLITGISLALYLIFTSLNKDSLLVKLISKIIIISVILSIAHQSLLFVQTKVPIQIIQTSIYILVFSLAILGIYYIYAILKDLFSLIEIKVKR